MSDNTVTQRLNLYISSEEAEKALRKQRDLVAQYRKELIQLAQTDMVDKKEFKRLEKELHGAERTLRSMQSTTMNVESAMSIRCSC